MYFLYYMWGPGKMPDSNILRVYMYQAGCKQIPGVTYNKPFTSVISKCNYCKFLSEVENNSCTCNLQVLLNWPLMSIQVTCTVCNSIYLKHGVNFYGLLCCSRKILMSIPCTRIFSFSLNPFTPLEILC